MLVTHFIASDDVERSRRFYTEVLGGKEVFGPVPTVTLETPRDPDRVSAFLNIRVSDIHAVYAEWTGGQST
jgi:hypothetical protein